MRRICTIRYAITLSEPESIAYNVDEELTLCSPGNTITDRGEAMYPHPKKLLLLDILEVLKRHSDENHRLKQNEIRQYLEQDYGLVVDRKSVQRNLEDLICCGEYDINYSVIPRKKAGAVTQEEDFDSKTDFYYVPKITPGEMRLLIDSVVFSPSIPATQAENLISTLKELDGGYQTAKMKHVCITKTPFHTRSSNLFLNIETIEQAIEEKKKIYFRINTYGPDGLLHQSDPEPVTVSPLQMVAASRHYFLLARDDHSEEIRHFRIDKLSDITILSEHRGSPFDTELGNLGVRKYLASHALMFEGSPIHVTIQIKKDLLDAVIDSFGDSFSLSEQNNHYVITLLSTEDDMLHWALRHAGSVEVLAPQTLRQQLRDCTFHLYHTYLSTSEDCYNRAIEIAQKYGELCLINMDLTGRESYKELKGLSFVDLRNCNITDISFLAGQTELRMLWFANNRITDFSALSGLPLLENLQFEKTGLSSIQILKTLPRLKNLLLNEDSITNLDVLYDLHLKSLRITPAIAEKLDVEKLFRQGTYVYTQKQ